MLKAASRKRKAAEALVLITPPTDFRPSKRDATWEAAKPTATDMIKTTAEWPSEKARPTPTGRRPCCISLRVELSMAAMWSASTAWRSPNV